MITLKEVENMVNEVEKIMKEPLKTEQEYQDLIDNIVSIEKEIKDSKVKDINSSRITMLCNYMIFKLMLKVTHVLEFEAYGRRKMQ